MTTPGMIVNGAPSRPHPSKRYVAPDQETYHGIPVLKLRVGDPLPTPPVPTWYVIAVNPDLARYLLTFNHEHNRVLRQRSVSRYAGDMRAGAWMLTPDALAFSREPRLLQGQHRLMAVTEYGEALPMLVTFGWPSDIIYVIDRGTARTTSDALKVDAVPNANLAAAALSLAWQYAKTVGTRRTWAGFPTPTSSAVRAYLAADPDAWTVAVRQGERTYKRLDKAWSARIWAAAHFIIHASTRDQDLTAAFFEEVIEGTGAPRSATRVLADWARRRPVGETRSRDNREPIELIIRAFNAWRAGKSLTMVAQAGFELSKVRP